MNRPVSDDLLMSFVSMGGAHRSTAVGGRSRISNLNDRGRATTPGTPAPPARTRLLEINSALYRQPSYLYGRMWYSYDPARARPVLRIRAIAFLDRHGVTIVATTLFALTTVGVVVTFLHGLGFGWSFWR